MWQRFTEEARKVVFYAQEEAGSLGDNYVHPEHFLLGMLHGFGEAHSTSLNEPSVAIVLLRQLGVDLLALYTETRAACSQGSGKVGQDMQLTPRAKRIVDLAYKEANRLKHNFVGSEHLLLGLLSEDGGTALEVLTKFGMTLEAVRQKIPQLLADKASAKEQLLTLDEAVKFLGTSKPTLYRLLGQDEIKGLKVGRQWRFRKSDLITYMERSPVAVTAAPSEDLDMELEFFADLLGQEMPDLTGDAESKTVSLATSIIQLAINSRASDIHLEPTPTDFLLRLRVDGVLQETRRLPSRMTESLAAQFKTLADMNLNETRLPQDGRIAVKQNGKDFDLRVSVLPSLNGEAFTMRILDRSTVLVGLDNLGLQAQDLRQIRDLMQQPSGIVITTGPTGSGKTTLLYSCLQEIAGIERKIVTIEDPVEFQIPYLTQTQVNKKSGLTFAAALRAFLRQDPDIILASEMRDLESLQIILDAALTGHLVLTSLHTSDAPSALLRLIDMGAEPHLIAATVSGVVATRLIRRVCENCRGPVDLSSSPTLSYVAQLAAEGGYSVPEGTIFVQGSGCEQCRGRGYRGRMGLYEVLTMNEALAEAILRRASVEEMTDLAVAGGMRTLLADGIRKAVDGETTVEEVLRVAAVSV